MNITITENAAKEGKILLDELSKTDSSIAGLYIGIKGGGCAGFKYITAPMLKDDIDESYSLFARDGFKIYIDSISLTYMDGVSIDWEKTVMGSQITIRNPNATQTCGCGSSFS